MHTYCHASRTCVTCARWGGQRVVGPIVPAYFVTVIDSNAKGECYGGGFRTLNLLPTATCGKYEKWVAMK